MFQTGYYYKKLNETEKKLYIDYLQAIDKGAGVIDVGLNINSEQAIKIYQFVLYDNPHYFFLDTQIEITSYLFSKQVNIKYLYDKRRIQVLSEKVINRVKWIAHKCSKDAHNEYEKIKNIYEYFEENCVYASPITDESYSVIGALLKEEAVCQGYSCAFKYILDFMGIDCVMVVGELDGVGHAWNIVWVDNKPYHVDVTAGISICDQVGVCYDYLFQDDSTFDLSHKWNKGDYPLCKYTDLDYYQLNKIALSNYRELLLTVITLWNNKEANISIKLLGKNRIEFEIDESKSMEKLISDVTKKTNSSVSMNYTYKNGILHIRRIRG